MAKGKAAKRKKAGATKASRRPAKRSALRRAQGSAKRPTKKAASRAPARTAKPAKRAKAKKAPANVGPAKAQQAKAGRRSAPAKQPVRRPHLDRERRTLSEADMVPTPPSSLNMDRRGSAARSGRAEMEENRQNVASMGDDIAGGDIDVDVEDAYFTGDEAPGGDNTSPDVDVVDDIGKALGVQYEDNEELKSSDKITERDKHRWEWDPASAEDYKDRK
jgi:hypothetical protein